MAEETKPGEPITALEIKLPGGALVSYDYGEDVDAKDMPTSGFLPYLGVVQPLANCLKEGKDGYIPDAKPGMFLLSGDPPELFSGKDGLIAVPLHDRHLIVEKTSLDQNSKTVGRYPGDADGEVATKLRAKFGNNRKLWKSDAGNFMVERHDLTCALFRSVADVMAMKPIGACVLGLERSKMAAYNRLADNRNKIEKTKRPPLWAGMIQLKTFMDNHDGNDYYNIALTFPVQDDYRASLIDPKSEMFATWREQCRLVCKNIELGVLKGEENEGSSNTGDDGGKGKGKESEIPF